MRNWTKIIASALVSAAIIMQFVMPTNVYGGSMEPGFCDNDYLLVSKQAYRGKHLPKRGDVVVFRSRIKDEYDNDKILIKRIIGLPGDTIFIEKGMVYINGERLNETYVKNGFTNGAVGPMVIPENGYFCMGDNRTKSRDSRDRSVGIVDKDDIIGKVFFKLYPFDKFGKIGDVSQ